MTEFQKIGRYQIEQPLGSGSYANVFKATDSLLKRTVALKILKPALLADQEAFARFITEAQVGASLIHTRIAWVWDIGEVDGRYFIAMRYIDGASLDKIIAEHGCLGWEQALTITRQVGEALTFAHAAGLVHRDVKPQNILLSPGEGAVLTDFGLVRAMEASGSLTRTGMMLGTPQYMPPEIWTGEPAGPAADQYALACVLVQMLTGKCPFDAPTPPAIMMKHFAPVVLPKQWGGGAPSGLSGVLRQVFAQQPAERFASIEAFIAGLGKLAEPTTLAVEPMLENVIPKRSLTDSQQLGKEEANHLHAPFEPQSLVVNLPSQSEQQQVQKEDADQYVPGTIALQKVMDWQQSRQANTLKGKINLISPKIYRLSVDKYLEMEFVFIPRGDFWMGSNFEELNDYRDEQPRHKVYLNDYCISKFPVTNKQFVPFLHFLSETDFSYGNGSDLKKRMANFQDPAKADHPVTTVNWNDAKAFCAWLGRRNHTLARLPTEAEWEKAASGPEGLWYPILSTGDLKNYANVDYKNLSTTPVGYYGSVGVSGYGCCDMSGNVWEWCDDFYDPDYYRNSPDKNPRGPEQGNMKVLRGGSWKSSILEARCAARFYASPHETREDIGFRCVFIC